MMGLDQSVVGIAATPMEFEWTERDVLLYAVAVGAGAEEPTEELEFTTENTDGTSLVVLPTFANIITRVARAPMGDYDMTKLVHASQAMELHRPIPTVGRAIVTPTVISMFDKGNSALVTNEQVAVDAETGEAIATTRQTVFIRGAGGFGGPRGGSESLPVPERAPDVERTVHVRPEQALIYRLTGDRNPLHSNPVFAQRGGFARPILHGMCTYGFTGRVLMREFGGSNPPGMTSMSARFTRPVAPPAELTVQMWSEPEGVRFRTLEHGEPVIDAGNATFVNA